MINPKIITSTLLHLSIAISSQSQLDQWETLQPNIGISAMHMQLLHNNMVIMFDRTDFGTSNISLPAGLCRYDSTETALKFDCSAHSILYDIISNTFRPLKVQTDTWCSSGSVLTNGTLIQTGGYNDGDHVARMFTPCGYNETCDWIEFPKYLAQRRWYATNQILPDGRVIVVGGRREFNYEFFPRTNEWFKFGFLRETSDGKNENNLYPFLHLLPDGNLFIFANTRSILFDYKRNRIVKEFEEIPDKSPRNYPSSGSSVLLPLDDTKKNIVIEPEIMICGGAPRGSFARAKRKRGFLRATLTCGRLKLKTGEKNPRWEMETMPLRRVMGDMLILPTGDVIIINGAGAGTAGWEYARKPVTKPVIYYPDDRRFSVMSRSTRPRMYHSSAILLPDGRILVGGSNPHIYYNFSNVDYPTELSLEAYSPPYLSANSESKRPRILSSDKVVKYKRSFTVDFSVEQDLTVDLLSVRIVAPSFTTHSFAMNQRMVLLEVVTVAREEQTRSYRINAVGPSTAEIAPSGFYMMFLVHGGVPSSATWVHIE